MKIEIRRFYHDNDAIFSEIILLLRGIYANKVSKFFIYQDENYPTYLASMARDEKNFWIYYGINIDHGDLIGFALFTSYHNNIFLNQIIIKPAFQFKGLGTYLLYNVLGILNMEFGADYFKKLELDAFYSNTHARKVYDHMGMKAVPGLNWYSSRITSPSEHKEEIFDHSYRIEVDDNGFTQLLADRRHIGTIINGNRAKINREEIEDLDEALRFLRKHTKVRQVCITSKDKIDLPLVDRSITYTIKFSEIINQIKNK
jgi:GNAT superfamily N-acetyltransferase